MRLGMGIGDGHDYEQTYEQDYEQWTSSGDVHLQRGHVQLGSSGDGWNSTRAAYEYNMIWLWQLAGVPHQDTKELSSANNPHGFLSVPSCMPSHIARASHRWRVRRVSGLSSEGQRPSDTGTGRRCMRLGMGYGLGYEQGYAGASGSA